MLAYFKKNNPTISIDVEVDEEGATLKDFIQDTESDVRYQEMVQRKADFVRECINNLKEPYKTIIEMREIDQLQYKDIAEILQLNESTVKSRIRNGRILLENETKKMFKMLEEENPFEEVNLGSGTQYKAFPDDAEIADIDDDFSDIC